MEAKLPKSIVLSRETLGFCVYELDSELLDHQRGRFLVHSAGAMDLHHWSVEEFARKQLTVSRLYRQRWWRRRRWIEKSCDDWQRLAIARGLSCGYEDAKLHPYLRLATDVFAPLAVNYHAEPTEHDPTSDALGRELVYTDAYCDWVARGGCPDLGRYLGMYWRDEAS